MKLFYADPGKKKLQKLEIGIMVILLPIGLFWGALSYRDWANFSKAEALLEEASALTHSSQYSRAIPKLEEALLAYPEYYPAWEELAVSYHMQKEYQKAVDTYERGVQTLPENGNLHRELATAYHYAGHHDKELSAAELAVTLPNSDPLFTSQVLRRAKREQSGEIELGSHQDFEKAQEIQAGFEEDHTGHNQAVHEDHTGHDHASEEDHTGHNH